MYQYTVQVSRGQSTPYHYSFYAADDTDFNRQLTAWESATGFNHVPGTSTCLVRETRKVPEPLLVLSQAA